MTTNYYLDSRDEVVALDYNGLDILCPIIGPVSQGIEGQTYTKTYTGSLITIPTNPGAKTVLSVPVKLNTSYYVWFVVNGYCTAGPDIGTSFQQETQTRITVSNAGILTITTFQNIFSGALSFGGQTVANLFGNTSFSLQIGGNVTDTERWTWHATINYNEAV
jgi:hypothetical protein